MVLGLAASAAAGALLLAGVGRVKLFCASMLRQYERMLEGARVAKKAEQECAGAKPLDASSES